MPPAPPPADAPGITPGGFYTSVTVTITMTSMPGATIYYRAAADNTTDLSIDIDPTDNTTYTGTGTSVNTPTTFTSPEDVYRIKAMAVLADGRRSPETDIQIFGYDIDVDDDRLIEIRNLEMFNNIRNNLAGTGYAGIAVPAGGCPAAGCNGYELMTDLDFDQESSYVSGSANWTNNTWRPVDEVTPDSSSTDALPDSAVNAGFPGIGPGLFAGIFEGNGNSISNFYSRNTADTNNANIGLFAINTGTIRNIAVVDANLFGGTAVDNIGGLVGQNGGRIIVSSASGSTDGGAGDEDRVGGLVGHNDGIIIAGSVSSTGTGTGTGTGTSSADGGAGDEDIVGVLVGRNGGTGTIIASSASGSADGGDGDNDRVGGLVGRNQGTIIASYAIGDGNDATTSDADGGDGEQDSVGGLVGRNDANAPFVATIIASYATGSADGGAGDDDTVGGLVGFNRGGITASYATGNTNGGAGDDDRVGGLVGWNFFGDARITASYAIGDADGGAGTGDNVGSLAGSDTNSNITASYGFGTVTTEAGETEETAGTGADIPTGVTDASDLTLALAGTEWNDASENTLGAWDFGADDTENPALLYNDYDGTTTVYASCTSDNGGFPDTIPGTTIMLDCETTLVGGFRP